MVIITFDLMEVEQLFEYPVKGLMGTSVACATVGPRGINNDRRWMLVDDSKSFISQRQFPVLTQLKPHFEASNLTIKRIDTGASVLVPLQNFNQPEQVEVWGQVVSAHACDIATNAWLSEQVGQIVRLVYMDEHDLRVIQSSPNKAIVSFADGYPVLLTASASLTDLNQRLESPVSIDRFRTNIHINTSTPFEEEQWQRIKIGDVVFTMVKKCARCHVINVDQLTGKAGKEPLRTLSTYRKEGNKVNFGINLIPERTGIIHQNDAVKILS